MMRVGNMRFAQVLGETLRKRTDVVRSHVLSALRQLVTKAKLTGKPEDVTAVAKRAQNFLPLLCKIYATRPTGSEESNLRSAVYATLVEYAAVAPEKDIREMFAAGLTNYQNEDAFVRDATMDILKAYLPYQDEDNLRLMYREAIKQIESDDHKVQKKAYRILEELCRCERPVCVQFVRNLISLPANDKESLRRIFLKSLSKASPSSQPPRLNCLISIVSMLGRCDDDSGEYMNFVREVLPEAVLCIRAVNVKARRASVELVKSVGTAMINWNRSGDSDEDEDDEDEGMKGADNSKAVSDLIDILAAGLAGEATVIKCTLLALASVLYEFSDSVPDATMERLLENVSALATCSSREVVGSCLSFVVVFIQVNPVFKTGRKDILERLVGVVVNMNEDCLRHHRTQVTKVLTRLVRKFGYELVCGMVPKDDEIMHKRLKNIHKEQARKKRNEEKKLSERDDDEDDDDDGFDEAVKRKSLKAKTMDEIIDAEDSDDELMDDDEDDKRSKKKRKNQRQTFIVENEDKETIVDFLDSKAASQVTSMKPQSVQKSEAQAKAKKDKNGGFDLAPDGRLLIKDDSDDSDDDVDEKDAKSDDDDDDENTFQSLVTSSSNRKRKRGTSVASGATGKSGASMTSGRAMKYQAGGSGIHR